jgi:hypothetical protein
MRLQLHCFSSAFDEPKEARQAGSGGRESVRSLAASAMAVPLGRRVAVSSAFPLASDARTDKSRGC